MAGTPTVSLLISNSIPKILSQQKPELYPIKNRAYFIKRNPHSNFPKIIGVNFGNIKSSTRLLAGLSEVEPDPKVNVEEKFQSDEFEGKSSWPELVGVNGKVAAAVIEKENPIVNAIVLKDGTPVTRDRRPDRVWVWVDDNGIVIRTPQIG